MIRNFPKVTQPENRSARFELPEYKARAFNLSALLPPGFIINEKSSRPTAKQRGVRRLRLSQESPLASRPWESFPPTLGHFPICQMKFASGDLQGPAGSESVILQERGPSSGSRSAGDKPPAAGRGRGVMGRLSLISSA